MNSTETKSSSIFKSEMLISGPSATVFVMILGVGWADDVLFRLQWLL